MMDDPVGPTYEVIELVVAQTMIMNLKLAPLL